MKQKIDLVAFDLGNVLCTVDEISAAKKLAAKNNQKWGYVHEIVFGQDAKLRFERGEITFDEHARDAIKILKLDMSITEVTEIYNSVIAPSTNMFPLVSQISKTYRIALASNTSEPHWKYAQKFLPFSSLLNPVIVSYLVGTHKPEKAFYERLVNESGVPADRILFIDDLETNVEGARKAGIIGLQFSTQENLETALTSLELL
ncbi:MAG: HAD family phosphatase [SAR202 cluster bacterium]|nr:HAD family phosphatase [SAR202 cluster bacterium]|tara:strand:- start:2770 stop:3378 length:609 start_codon:yes stop_codon:yes gene_type:complete